MASYVVGDVDNVNPVTGNLYLNIPLLSYPQRGRALRLTFRIYYNDKQWFLMNWPVPFTSGHEPLPPPPFWGWYATPNPDQNPTNLGVYVARDQHLDSGKDDYHGVHTVTSGSGAYSVVTDIYSLYGREPNGAKHYYGDSQRESCTSYGTLTCPVYVSSLDQVYPSNDGAGFRVNPSSSSNSWLVGPDGVTYTVDSTTGYETVADPTDPADNRILQNAGGWLDSLGREIPGSYDGPGTATGIINASYDVLDTLEPIPGVPAGAPPSDCPAGTTAARQWVTPGVNGASQTFFLCYSPVPFQTAFNLDQVFNTTTYQTVSEASGTATMLTAIVLPNKQTYTFAYDNYLSLTNLGLPTGGSISYTWQNVQPSTVYGMGDSETRPLSRSLKTRTVSPGSGQPARTWKYYWKNQYMNGASSGTLTDAWSVITDPTGADVEREVSPNGALNLKAYTGCSPHDDAADRTCIASGTQLLKQEEYTLTATGTSAARSTFAMNSVLYQYEPTTVITTLASASGDTVSKTVNTLTPAYGSCQVIGLPTGEGNPTPPSAQTVPECYRYNQIQQTDVYDYGRTTPGGLLQETQTSYYYQSHDAYKTANLLTLPDTEKVWSPDASGTLVEQSETRYGYDESDSPQGVFGNQTSVSRGLGSDVSGSSTKYNTYGMPIETKDGRGNPTGFTYDSTNLFLSKKQLPTTSGIVHTIGYNFDSYTGKLLSLTDENNNETDYSYTDPATNAVDPLNRLRSITYPKTTDGSTGGDGNGKKSYTYSDVPGSLTITEDTVQSTDNTKVTRITSFDGLGEVIRTSLDSDPYGAIIQDTTYDAKGRVWKSSNPYRSSTTDYTFTTYDALDRKLSQTTPDNYMVQWSYAGNVVTFTNQLDYQWLRTSDALGRLTQVAEPAIGTAKSSVTTYQYTARGLTCVDQWGVGNIGNPCGSDHNRTFTYDSLSRLLTSQNPESGTICYGISASGRCTSGYDGNGNVTVKTDGRNVVTNYSYDALNRLVSKSYSGEATAKDGSSHPTLSSCYLYDTGDNAGANTIGRVVATWTQAGTCPSSGSAVPNSAVTWSDAATYDAMGRLLASKRCLFAPCSWAGKLQYKYDLAGNQVYSSNGITNPQAPQFGWSMSRDAGGRLGSVISSWTDTAHPAVLFAANQDVTVNGVPTHPYGVFGLAAAQYSIDGSGNVGLLEARAYDSRGRLTLKSVYGTGSISSTTTSVVVAPSTVTSSGSATATVHVSCNTACGSIDLLVDNMDLGLQALDGSGNFSGTISASGLQGTNHTVTANYRGTGAYSSSSGSAPFTVTSTPPKVWIGADPPAFSLAEGTTIYVHVDCNAACGDVLFLIDGKGWAEFPLYPSGDISIDTFHWPSSYLTVGQQHSITAQFLGSPGFPANSASVDVNVLPAGTQQTTLDLSMSTTSFTTAEDALVFAHVGCNSACGSVQFLVDGRPWVDWPLDDNGNTSADTFYWPNAAFTQDGHHLTAIYSGNATYAQATNGVDFTVNPIGTNQTTVSLSVNPATFSLAGGMTTFSHVDCGQVTGLVQYTIDGNTWVYWPIDANGNAYPDTLGWASGWFAAGNHTLVANFLGNSTCAAASSPPVSITITQ